MSSSKHQLTIYERGRTGFLAYSLSHQVSDLGERPHTSRTGEAHYAMTYRAFVPITTRLFSVIIFLHARDQSTQSRIHIDFQHLLHHLHSYTATFSSEQILPSRLTWTYP